MEKKSKKVPQDSPKIEVTADYIRIPNPKFQGDCTDIRTIDIQPSAGIKALWCVSKRQVKTYLFDKEKWDLDKAKKWVKDNAKEYRPAHIKAIIKKRKEGKKFTAIASEEVEDRDGEVVKVDGWDLKAFKENPVLLWAHNKMPNHPDAGLPIGKVIKIGKKLIDGTKKLIAEFEIQTITEFGRTVKKFLDDSILNTLSVGFRPIEREGSEIQKQELLELSLVAVPALASAHVISRAKELNIPEDVAMMLIEEKGVVPYKGHAPAAESRAWDANAAINRIKSWAGGPAKEDIRWGDLKQGYTWYDTENTESLGSYKLPHHDIVDGKLVTVWRGVAASMAAILGARGGVAIPENEKRRVYSHIKRHYAQFDKDAPDFKFVENLNLKHLFEAQEERLEKKYYRSVKGNIEYMMSKVRKYDMELRKEIKKRKQEDNKKKDDLTYKYITETLTEVKDALKSIPTK